MRCSVRRLGTFCRCVVRRACMLMYWLLVAPHLRASAFVCPRRVFRRLLLYPPTKTFIHSMGYHSRRQYILAVYSRVKLYN